MEKIKSNVFFMRELYKIGGIESFYYYLVKKYGDIDITIYYITGDLKQVLRLSKYARVIKYSGEKIKCKRAFFNYNLDIIDNVEAEEYIQLIHACYKSMKLSSALHPKINRYIAVSKTAADEFEEYTGAKCEVCYNPIVIERKEPLIFLSATRLSDEKGERRIAKLADELQNAGIDFIWFIFTADQKNINNNNIIFLEPRLNIVDYFPMANYFVQLSDCEAFCYSVVEALTCGVPVIVTDLPVFKELGVNSKNSIKLGLDMNKIPIDKIKKGLKPFEYKPPADVWSSLLVEGKKTYKPGEECVAVKCINDYTDKYDNHKVRVNEEFIVTKKRADELLTANVVKLL